MEGDHAPRAGRARDGAGGEGRQMLARGGMGRVLGQERRLDEQRIRPLREGDRRRAVRGDRGRGLLTSP